MGFFDFFKGKKKKPSEGDALDLALQKAMEDPASREAFYDCLLQSKLLVRAVKSDEKKCGT